MCRNERLTKPFCSQILFVAQVCTILKIKSLNTEHNVGKRPPLIYRNWENKEETYIQLITDKTVL